MELDQIIMDTMTSDGGTLALSHRPRLRDGAPPWRAMLSYGGEDHPVAVTPTRAVYGYGQTAAEALEQLAEHRRAVRDEEAAG